MNNKDITTRRENIMNAIAQGHLAIAFKQLREFSETLLTWEYTDEISRMEESYKYMLEYAMKGAADPSRAAIYEDTKSRMRDILDKLERHALTNEAPTLYYNTLRYHNISGKNSISSLIRRYESRLHDYSTMGLNLDTASDMAQSNRRERELIENELFNLIWITLPLNNDDYEALQHAINSDAISSQFKQLIVSATLLALFEYYDYRKLMLIIDAYLSQDNTLSATALIALLLSLYTYRNRSLGSKIEARIKLLPEKKTWHSDLRDGFLELVRARDTERITRTMRDEVVPEMMKLKPEITKRFGANIQADDIADMDLNPEWQEMLEKSGIADKMKKLFEIQLEGGDVFMSTFAHLKSYPFFNDISHWFTPFSTERSEVMNTPGEYDDVVRLLENSPVFCNSDKYSFLFSLQSIPMAQREMFKSQINSQVNGLMEIQRSANDTVTRNRKHIMNRYVQDLYRFFKLFRRKNEFKDPFVSDLNMVSIDAIKNEYSDIESLQAIAEFYFKHRYYVDALSLFKVIEDLSYPDIQLFEKMGYCYETMHNYTEALKYYEQAELLNVASKWTMRHLALCYRKLNMPQKALSYYKKLLEQEESLPVLMATGNCYLEMNDYDNATKYYYKVNYLDTDKQPALRQLAWSLMMQQQFDKAKALYDKILMDSPMPDDYLNMGHLSLALCDNNNALNYYKLSISKGGYTIAEFEQKIFNDREAFKTMGLDPSITPLIVDAVSYSQSW